MYDATLAETVTIRGDGGDEKAQGKTYEFHTYEGAGHAFFAVNRTAYRPDAAVDGWAKIFTWFNRYLAS